MSNSINEDSKEIARYLRSLLGGSPRVNRYWDGHNISHVDILTAPQSPTNGLSTVATIGLSSHSIGLNVDSKPLRVELLFTCTDDQIECENILSTCAFEIINSGKTIRPGSVFENIIEMYNSDLEVKHIFFVSPFLWQIQSREIGKNMVTWLSALPISDNEMNFSASNGADALENLLQERDADVFDLNRRSIV